MPSFDWISNFLDVIFYLLLGHKWLIPTERGGRLLKIFESGIANWFRARANTEILEEVSSLKNFFIRSMRVVIPAVILLAITPLQKFPVVQQIIGSLGIIFLIAYVGWVSLDWTFDHRSSILSSFDPTFIISLALTVVAMILIVTPVLEQLLIRISQAQGWGLFSGVLVNTLIVIFWIVFFMFCALFFYISNWAIFGALSFFMVGAIYITSFLSRFLIKTVNRDVAWVLVFLASALIKIRKNLL
jgi:hypothetical protein